MTYDIIAILGPSGVGKSTIIRYLININKNVLEYLTPLTTRDLRQEENDKIKISKKLFFEQVKSKEIILPNKIYDTWYGISKQKLESILNLEKVALIDWPIQRLNDLKNELKDYKILSIYIMPKNLESLQKQINKDGRDPEGTRYQKAIRELKEVEKGLYTNLDVIIKNNRNIDNAVYKINDILKVYLNGG